MSKRWIVTALVLLLAGCASQPKHPTPVFVLPQLGSSVLATSVPEVKIILPDFLNQGGIVLQTSDVTLVQARNHRWAAPLARQLQQTLQGQLSKAGVSKANGSKGRVIVRLSAFQGNRGKALVAGQWQYQSKGQSTSGAFREIRPLEATGYAALVRQLGMAWGAVTAQITSDIIGETSNSR